MDMSSSSPQTFTCCILRPSTGYHPRDYCTYCSTLCLCQLLHSMLLCSEFTDRPTNHVGSVLRAKQGNPRYHITAPWSRPITSDICTSYSLGTTKASWREAIDGTIVASPATRREYVAHSEQVTERVDNIHGGPLLETAVMRAKQNLEYRRDDLVFVSNLPCRGLGRKLLGTCLYISRMDGHRLIHETIARRYLVLSQMHWRA